MLCFYHVTRKEYVKNILSPELMPSIDIAAGGMSADAATAHEYAEPDKGLICVG